MVTAPRPEARCIDVDALRRVEAEPHGIRLPLRAPPVAPAWAGIGAQIEIECIVREVPAFRAAAFAPVEIGRTERRGHGRRRYDAGRAEFTYHSQRGGHRSPCMTRRDDEFVSATALPAASGTQEILCREDSRYTFATQEGFVCFDLATMSFPPGFEPVCWWLRHACGQRADCRRNDRQAGHVGNTNPATTRRPSPASTE